jgi:HD-GYP domain-containing protein (c-di-GMP phosphodiesterase class II)
MTVVDQVEALHAMLQQARNELKELNKIGMALMSERDPDNLLRSILRQARTLTTSDAGSLYLVEEDEAGNQHLHFLRAQNDSLPNLPDPDFTLPLDRSNVAGYAASTGEPLVIEDAYDIPESAPYSFNKGFDEAHGYRAKGMLMVPMKDHKDQVLGVVQLINRKADPDANIRSEDDAQRYVLPYGTRDVELVQSLAGQAAVSIENARLYRAIENLFEGFITAAVTAIDQRDPTTAGHSLRVTELTMALAELVHEKSEGRFAGIEFTAEERKQLRYAGLLHDFGKVGVREEVLTKPKKLPPVLWEQLAARFARAKAERQIVFERSRAAYLEENGNGDYAAWIEEARTAHEQEIARLDDYWQAINDANTPRVLPEEGAQILQEIRGTVVEGADGEEIGLLTEEELEYLRIKRGSLSDDEVKQIQSHVVQSYDFLQHIPWTDDLGRIAEIVRGHHEKLGGGGYPDGVSGDDICLETRMMTIADIFDALTASDRPYKKAMPLDRALSILRMEVEDGNLDQELVEMFIESGVYHRVLDTDWHEFL